MLAAHHATGRNEGNTYQVGEDLVLVDVVAPRYLIQVRILVFWLNEAIMAPVTVIKSIFLLLAIFLK